jgi:hypothetical protein
MLGRVPRSIADQVKVVARKRDHQRSNNDLTGSEMALCGEQRRALIHSAPANTPIESEL